MVDLPTDVYPSVSEHVAKNSTGSGEKGSTLGNIGFCPDRRGRQERPEWGKDRENGGT